MSRPLVSSRAPFAGRIFVVGPLLLAVLGLIATSGHADLVLNGSFEQTTNGNGQLGYNTDATGWTIANNGYDFLFAPATADTIGAPGQYGNLSLWGPGNGSNNGLPATSPDGGNYVAADGAFQVGAIQQTLTGLTAGETYTVGFWWGGAQQSGFFGDTTDQWQVGFGSQTQLTPVASLPSQGFSGWMYQTFNFTADGSSDVLSFLAIGTPSGVPPFALLDGVTVTGAVPEPGSLLIWGVFGMVGLGAVRLRRRKSAKV